MKLLNYVHFIQKAGIAGRARIGYYFLHENSLNWVNKWLDFFARPYYFQSVYKTVSKLFVFPFIIEVIVMEQIFMVCIFGENGGPLLQILFYFRIQH